MRGLDTPLLRFHAVSPEGRIKTILFERNLTSPILIVEWGGEDPKRPTELVSVDLLKSIKKEGWIGLEDLYQQEDRLEDFDSYCRWEIHASSVPGVPMISDDYLPDEVLRRRASYKQEQIKLSLPAPKRRKAKEPKESKEPKP